MRELIKVVALKDKQALFNFRTMPGLCAALYENEIWIRGIMLSGTEESTTARIPSQRNYFLDKENQLFLPYATTPVARLTELDWKPLKEMLPVTMPVAAFSGIQENRYNIRIIASESEKGISATLLSVKEWKRIAVDLPETRLKQIHFAVASDNRVLLLNSRFLPGAGKHFWIEDYFLLPLGFDFDPPQIRGMLRNRLNPSEDSVFLFDTEGAYERISLTRFTQGSRLTVHRLNP
jgi:hypothetical protein